MSTESTTPTEQSTNCLDHYGEVFDDAEEFSQIRGYDCKTYRLPEIPGIPQEISFYNSYTGATHTFMWFDGKMYLLGLFRVASPQDDDSPQDVTLPEVGTTVSDWRQQVVFRSRAHEEIHNMLFNGYKSIKEILAAVEYVNKHKLGDDVRYYPFYNTRVHFKPIIAGTDARVIPYMGDRRYPEIPLVSNNYFESWLAWFFTDVDQPLHSSVETYKGLREGTKSQWKSLALHGHSSTILLTDESGDIYEYKSDAYSSMISDAIKLVLGMITLRKNDPRGEEIGDYWLTFKQSKNDPKMGEYWHILWNSDDQVVVNRLVRSAYTQGVVNYDYKKNLPYLGAYKTTGATSRW